MPAEMTRCQWATCLLPPGSPVLTQHRRLSEEPQCSPMPPGASPHCQHCQGCLAFPEAAQASHPQPSPPAALSPGQGPEVPSDWRGRLGGIPLSWVWAQPWVEEAWLPGPALLGVTGPGLIRDPRRPPDFIPPSFLGEAEGSPPTWMQCSCSVRTPASPIGDEVSAVSGETPQRLVNLNSVL